MVERFEFTCPDCDPDVVNVNHGRYARHSDYAALEAQLAEVREKAKQAAAMCEAGYAVNPLKLATSILTALEATPPAPKVTDAMVMAGRAHYSEGGCMGLGEHEVLEVVESIIIAALTAAQESGS